jgi:hypothetical protein
VIHVQGPGASRRENAVRQSALADEHFKKDDGIDIERKIHFEMVLSNTIQKNVKGGYDEVMF